MVVALALLTGCTRGGDDPTSPDPTPSAAAPSTATGDDDACRSASDQEIEAGGTTWRYDVQVPPGATSDDRLPVVYLLHGLGGSGAQIAAYTGFAEAARTDDFVLVTPQANGVPPEWGLDDGPGTDVDLVRALLEAVPERTCADPDRQYVAGLSNGSALAFALACAGDLPVRAYGGVAAAGFEPQCDAAPPTSFVYVHGTADEVVPFDGGPTPIRPVRPVDETLAAWARHDGCDATPEGSRAADDVERRAWTGCDDGARIEAYVVEGGGHTWPGAQPVPFLGATSDGIDATDVMLEFFGLA